MGDSIKLGRVSMEMSCGGTGCLSCRGKQSTLLLLLLLSSSGRRADCLVPVPFGVRLRGACVGLCVMAVRENEYHGCSWGVSCCCNTGCVAWQGKQSSSSSSSSGRSLLFSILS